MNYLYQITEFFIESEMPILFFNKKFCLSANAINNSKPIIHINYIAPSEKQFQLFRVPMKYEYVLSYKNINVLLDDKWENIITDNTSELELGLILFHICRFHAVHHHMLQLHSSLISVNDRGLMFLGPSDIGKTTQAELWNKYRDALIINGDIVFVQETEDAFLGWGTPWHGSSPYCENTSVPVHAMIVLKQAPENSIRELSGFEKVTAVSNSVFYPQWLENGMELCLETLDHLLSSVPVYELSCRPDEDAVRITEEAVFGGRL